MGKKAVFSSKLGIYGLVAVRMDRDAFPKGEQRIFPTKKVKRLECSTSPPCIRRIEWTKAKTSQSDRLKRRRPINMAIFNRQEDVYMLLCKVKERRTVRARPAAAPAGLWRGMALRWPAKFAAPENLQRPKSTQWFIHWNNIISTVFQTVYFSYHLSREAAR